MTEGDISFSERLVAALAARKPEIGMSAWYGKHAAEIDCDPDTLKRWCDGRAKPGGEALLALFDHFGAEFEAEVRGVARPMTPRQHMDLAAFHIAQAKRGIPS